MQLGRVGLWTFQLDLQPAARAQEAAREIEALGYGAIWVPEALGREAFTNAQLLLAATSRIVVATGIANVWARDAMAMAVAGDRPVDATVRNCSGRPSVASMLAKCRKTDAEAHAHLDPHRIAVHALHLAECVPSRSGLQHA